MKRLFLLPLDTWPKCHILAQVPVAALKVFSTMPALQPMDWPAWKRAAGDFLRRHPQVQVRELTETISSCDFSPCPKVMPSRVRTMLVTGTGPVDAPQTVVAVVAAPCKEEAL